MSGTGSTSSGNVSVSSLGNANLSTRYFVVVYGNPDLNTQNARNTSLYKFPEDGTVLGFSSTSPTGYVGVTPTQFITYAIDSGQPIPATTLTILTSKGQLVTSDGLENIVLNPGIDGRVLVTDSTSSSGLRWADPAAATGFFAPVNGLAARDTVGSLDGVLQATRFVSYVAATDSPNTCFIPNAALGGTIGSSTNVFTGAYINTINAQTLIGNSVTALTSNLSVTAGATGALTLGAGTASITVNSSTPEVLISPAISTAAGTDNGFYLRNSTKRLWRITLDTNGNLIFSFNTGTDAAPVWVVKQLFSSS